jgi:DNA repair protein RadC
MSDEAEHPDRRKQPDSLREQHYPISEAKLQDSLPQDERPRELMERLGAENVKDKHLLAIILRTGTKGRNVLDLAEGLLREYGSFAAMSQASVDDLKNVHGLGPVKAQLLKAVFEIGRRASVKRDNSQLVVRTPAETLHAIRAHISPEQRDHEAFWVLLLNRRYHLIRPPLEITRGILDASLVHPREVFKEAIRSNAAAIILAHNHPSGDPTPSAEDIRITRQLVEAGKIIQIDVLDHVIIGNAQAGARDYASLRESGLVNFGS